MEKTLGLKEHFADEVHQVRDVQKELKLLGTYTKKINGGKIFSYNLKTEEIKVVEVVFQETVTLDLTTKSAVPVNAKLKVEKGHVYVEALNKKNAIKKLLRNDYICIT